MSATNVQFSVALHVMAGLGVNYGKEVTSGALAESVNANASFVRKVLSKLVKSGMVEATRGKNGSYRLARPPEQITLLDIYRHSEAPEAFAIHSYPEERQCLVSSNIKVCTAEILQDAQASFEEALSRKTLADFVSGIQAK